PRLRQPGQDPDGGGREVPQVGLHHHRHLRGVARGGGEGGDGDGAPRGAEDRQRAAGRHHLRRGRGGRGCRHGGEPPRGPGGGARRDRGAPPLKPGSTVRVDVVVRTRAIGHFFPGGTVDAFDVWLELQGRDANGKVIYWSGMVQDGGKGPVEPGAHFYKS